MPNILDVRDTINGAEGRAYANIDGQNINLFNIKKLEAKTKMNKKPLSVLGDRAKQNKSTGWAGSGTMTMYYVSSQFRAMVMDYIKNGQVTYFDIIVTNDDPATELGPQTTVLKRCSLDEIVMAKLDVEDDALEEDVPFTFEDIDMPEKFGVARMKG